MEIDIKEYIAPLLKWWWLILISTMIAGVSSYFATRQQVPLYQSTATLMIGTAIENPNPSGNDLFITQQLGGAYVNLANRASFREAVMENLGMDWLPEIFVRNLFNTNFIDIFVTDTDPQRAQAVAAEMSRQLILRSPTSPEEESARQDFVNQQLDDYQKAIKETQAEIAEKNQELGELISAREIADLQGEIATLQTTLQNLQANYASLLPSSQRGATNTLREVEPASFPTFPQNQNNRTTILLAAGIGFVLASAAAYALEYLNDSVESPAVITKLTDLPTLSGIARIKSDENILIAMTQPRSPITEAFRVLRTAVQFSAVDSPHRSLLVTSAIPGEGKSTTSSNLAVVMAQAGHNVLLVDTDLRRPSLHTIFDLPNKRGLTSLLLEFSRSNQDLDIRNLVTDTVQATRVGGLQVLSCGPIPPNPSELLGSSKMRELLNILAAQFDFVILDSSPVLSVTDAVVLSLQVDTILLVVKAGVSKKEHVKQAVARMREVNANLIGCVLNAISSKSDLYSSYYYYQDPYYSQYDEKNARIGEEDDSVGKLRKRFWGKQAA